MHALSLTVFQYIPTVLFIILPVIVYLDAASHGIGKHKSGSRYLNMSAGAWAAAVILLGSIGLFIYLLKRRSLIQAAHSDNVLLGVSHRATVALLVLIFSGAFHSLSIIAL